MGLSGSDVSASSSPFEGAGNGEIMAHGLQDCLPLPVGLCLAQSTSQEEAAAVLRSQLGSLCPLGKEDGAWPVLLSLCTGYSEQKTVTISKARNFPHNCLQGISPGDGPEAFEDAVVAGVPEAGGTRCQCPVRFPSRGYSGVQKKNSE